MRVAGWLLVAVGCTITVTKDGGPGGDTAADTGEPTTSDPTSDPTTGDTGATDPAVDADGDGVAAAEDCDDSNPRAYPGAPPSCRAEDADCDGNPEPRARVPEDYATVQAAIDAGVGERICVGDGVHAGFVVSDGAVEVGGSAAATIDGGSAGPAVAVSGGALVLADLRITGGAGGLRAEDGEVTVARVDFDGVRCDGDCEGAVVYSDADLAATDVRVQDASVTGDNLRGALVFIDGGAAALTDWTFSGGSITATGFVHGGAIGVVGTDATLTRVEVRDLGIAAQSVQGGAVYLFSGELVGRNLVVTGLDVAATGEVEGTAVAGSGAFSELDLAFLSIGGNHAAAPTCAGSAVWAVSAVGALSHAAIAGNTFTCDRVNGGAVAIEAGDPWAVRYTDVFGHADGDWSGMPDPTGVDGNLAVDPAFADPARGDLHLAAGSPLIDAGDPALLDPDGTAADIGGYGGPTAP